MIGNVLTRHFTVSPLDSIINCNRIQSNSTTCNTHVVKTGQSNVKYVYISGAIFSSAIPWEHLHTNRWTTFGRKMKN